MGGQRVGLLGGGLGYPPCTAILLGAPAGCRSHYIGTEPARLARIRQILRSTKGFLIKINGTCAKLPETAPSDPVPTGLAYAAGPLGGPNRATSKMTTSAAPPPVKTCPVCRIAMLGRLTKTTPPRVEFDHFECLNCGLLMDYSGSTAHPELRMNNQAPHIPEAT
jgi:hypothetical protein